MAMLPNERRRILRYMTRDGEIFEGDTPRAAALALRAMSRDPRRDLSEFMAVTAAAARLQTGRSIRTYNPAAFLDDLESAGLIERIDL
jgi:hypothetical protein